MRIVDLRKPDRTTSAMSPADPHACRERGAGSALCWWVEHEKAGPRRSAQAAIIRKKNNNGGKGENNDQPGRRLTGSPALVRSGKIEGGGQNSDSPVQLITSRRNHVRSSSQEYATVLRRKSHLDAKNQRAAYTGRRGLLTPLQLLRARRKLINGIRKSGLPSSLPTYTGWGRPPGNARNAADKKNSSTERPQSRRRVELL